MDRDRRRRRGRPGGDGGACLRAGAVARRKARSLESWPPFPGRPRAAARSGCRTLGGPVDRATRKQLLRYGDTRAVKAILLITMCWEHLRDADCTGGFNVPAAVLDIRARQDWSFKSAVPLFQLSRSHPCRIKRPARARPG